MSRRTPGGGDGFGGGGSDIVRRSGHAHVRGDGAGEGRDIAGEGRVNAQVGGGMFADDAHHGRSRFARVVEVGEGVSEAGAEMEERRGGLAESARVAVGRTGTDAFEETEYAAHATHTVQRGHEMHLRGARIHETGVDAAGHQGL